MVSDTIKAVGTVLVPVTLYEYGGHPRCELCQASRFGENYKLTCGFTGDLCKRQLQRGCPIRKPGLLTLDELGMLVDGRPRDSYTTVYNKGMGEYVRPCDDCGEIGPHAEDCPTWLVQQAHDKAWDKAAALIGDTYDNVPSEPAD